MTRVFISHASADRKAAAKLCKLLEDREVDCWMAPRDVRPGHDYGEEIIHAIEDCTAMVLVLSDHANDSKFVKREVERAVSRGKSVFPVRIREVEPSASLELFISSTHWIDAWKPPIQQWLDQLVQAIDSLDGTATAKPHRRRASRRARGRTRLFAVAVLLLAAGVGLWWFFAHGSESRWSEWFDGTQGANGSSTAHSSGRGEEQPTQPSSLAEQKPAWTLLRSLHGHGHSVNCIAFDNDGDRLISGSEDETIKVWNVETGECLRTLTPEMKARNRYDTVSSVAVSPDGKLIASAHYNPVFRIWKLATGEILQRNEENNRTCYSVGFSPDGKLLAVGTGSNVELWDFESETVNSVLEARDGSFTFNDVAFNPDGSRLTSASKSGTVKIWDCQTGECRRTIKPESRGPTPQFECVAFSPDGSRIAAAGTGDVVFLWDSSTGELVHTLAGHNVTVNDVAFNPEGSYLASASRDRTLRIWDTETGKTVQTLDPESGYVETVAFSPDGRLIAAGCQNQVIKTWTTDR